MEVKGGWILSANRENVALNGVQELTRISWAPRTKKKFKEDMNFHENKDAEEVVEESRVLDPCEKEKGEQDFRITRFRSLRLISPSKHSSKIASSFFLIVNPWILPYPYCLAYYSVPAKGCSKFGIGVKLCALRVVWEEKKRGQMVSACPKNVAPTCHLEQSTLSPSCMN